MGSVGPCIRVGVVGAGSWSALAHVPALLANPHAEIVGLADSDPARLAATADHYRIEGRYPHHRDLLATGVDALVIATPHATHHAIARDAIDAGAHLLVEKPLTLRAHEARDLDVRARGAGLHLVVGYTFNFTPGAADARAAVARGELGAITLVSVLFASRMEDYLRGLPGDQGPYVLGGPSAATYSDPLLAGGGQGQSQATHALEMMMWITGLRARSVSALMSNREARVDVIDVMAYELENGALGTLATSGALSPEQSEQQELRYYGTRGLLVQNLVNGEIVLHPANGPARVISAPTSPATAYPIAAPVDCLVDLLRGDGENLASADAAIATVELLEAAYRSAAEDGRRVAVCEFGEGR